MTQSTAECFICHEPLPTGEPIAFMDKGRLIHVGCYRALPPPVHQAAGRHLERTERLQARDRLHGSVDGPYRARKFEMNEAVDRIGADIGATD